MEEVSVWTAVLAVAPVLVAVIALGRGPGLGALRDEVGRVELAATGLALLGLAAFLLGGPGKAVLAAGLAIGFGSGFALGLILGTKKEALGAGEASPDAPLSGETVP